MSTSACNPARVAAFPTVLQSLRNTVLQAHSHSHKVSSIAEHPANGYTLVARTLASLGVRLMYGVIGIPVTELASAAQARSPPSGFRVTTPGSCNESEDAHELCA